MGLPLRRAAPRPDGALATHNAFATGYSDATFTGQRRDVGTGLYFYGARYYDSAIGRFIQPDTIVPDTPDTSLVILTVNFSHSTFLEEIGHENRHEKSRGLGVVQWFQEASMGLTPELARRAPEPKSSQSLVVQGPIDPQNLNRYAYVRNNPARYIDPAGFWTFGIGFGGSIGAGMGVSGSVMIVFDGKGHVGLALSGGGGGYAGLGGSGGLTFQYTTASVIQELNGPVVQSGGSVDLGISVGGEWVAQKGPKGPIHGVNVNIGVGIDAKIPCPIEAHSFLEYTKVLEMVRDAAEEDIY